MNNGKANLDLDRKYSEHWFKSKIKLLEKAKNDKEKELRLGNMECPYCWYFGSNFGGAAMTSWECALCPQSFINGSTNTPTLCDACSTKENRCRRCGDKMVSVNQ